MIDNEGIKLISNDSLRFKITKYYKQSIPLQLTIQETTISQIYTASERHLPLFKNLNWSQPMEPWDYEQLKENRGYISWLAFTASNRDFEAGRFKSLLSNNQMLTKDIEKELTLIK